MAAQPQPLSLEDFHRFYDGARPAYEYWYGSAVQKPMPTILHGLVRFIVMMLLERAGWNPSSEVRLKVATAEPVPDVIAVRGKFKGRYPAAAPELCIEILSTRDTLPGAFDKANRYIHCGTQCVWIIDPEKRTAWILSREGAPEPALADLFAEVDRKLELGEERD
jgi:Uma2 family endonuclease